MRISDWSSDVCASELIGWRVLWFVAPVMIRMSSDTAAAAPLSVPASLMLNRSEMKAAHSRRLSASRTSSSSSRGDFGDPRTEERPEGKECVSPCQSRGYALHKKKKRKKLNHKK